MPNFDAPAKLYRHEMTKGVFGTKMPIGGTLVHSGTVADCVMKVMGEREPERVLYSMTQDLDNRLGITDHSHHDTAALDYQAIQVIYKHPDFPKA